MDRKLSDYPDKYDWVKVRSNKKHRLGRRPWNDNTNMLIGKDEVVILPRGVKGSNDSELNGMKFYFKNNFYEVIDPEPFGNDVENSAESAPEDDDENYPCPECDRSFDSEKGLNTHKRQKHKKEETED